MPENKWVLIACTRCDWERFVPEGWGVSVMWMEGTDKCLDHRITGPWTEEVSSRKADK